MSAGRVRLCSYVVEQSRDDNWMPPGFVSVAYLYFNEEQTITQTNDAGQEALPGYQVFVLQRFHDPNQSIYDIYDIERYRLSAGEGEGEGESAAGEGKGEGEGESAGEGEGEGRDGGGGEGEP
jgi:uncharacterized membrane protein YgcG